MKYQRILLKLSGEALMGELNQGIDPEIYGGIDNNFYPRPQTGVFGVTFEF